MDAQTKGETIKFIYCQYKTFSCAREYFKRILKSCYNFFLYLYPQNLIQQILFHIPIPLWTIMIQSKNGLNKIKIFFPVMFLVRTIEKNNE